jgi:inhibitor of growth protein 4
VGGGNTSANLGTNTGSESTGGLMAAVLPTLSHGADVLDMPVDPNEPTYCLCHQVSYGEMIGCDNPDVSIGLYLLET